MKITRKSIFDGKTRTRDIDVTHEQLNRWVHGELIQRAMPHLSEDDREFILTGATPEQWDQMFGTEV